MTQTIEYVVKVNATQAQQAVAEVEKRFGGVDSVVARVDKSIIALERDMKDLNAAIAAGGPNVAHYRKELERLSASVGGTSGAAASAGGGAGGGRSLGMAALEASRAVEDLQYGLAGVVNNIPGLVMALGGGAGLTAAISLAAVGVNQLYKNFIAVPDATETATTTARSYIKDLRDEIAELGKDLRTVQIGATGVAMEEQRKRIQIAMTEARAVVDAVGGPQALADLRFLTKDRPEMLPSRGWGPLAGRNYVSPEAFQAAIDAQTKIDLEIRKMQQLQLIELEKADKEGAEKRGRESGRRYIEGVITAMADPRSEALAGMFSQAGLRSIVAGNIAEREMEADIDAAAARKELQLESLRTDALIQKMKTDIADEGAKERAKIAKREARDLERLGVDAAAAIGVFAAQAAMGQEAAFENLVSAASQQAGSLIMLKGGEVMAAGIAGMLTAPNPASAAQIAGGAGLVAAGAAVQQIGPGAVAMLSGKAGAMGGTGATSATRDPGAAPRTGSGGSSGGPMIVNVTYGAGGPLPEDIAREIHKVTASGNRRRGAA